MCCLRQAFFETKSRSPIPSRYEAESESELIYILIILIVENNQQQHRDDLAATNYYELENLKENKTGFVTGL